MKKFFFIATSIAITLIACTTVRLTSTWKDPQLSANPGYKNIVVLSLMEGVNNKELRTYMEKHMAEDLVKMGYNAKAATDVYGPRSFSNKTEDEVIELMRKEGFEAVISLAVLDVTKEETYVKGRAELWPGGIYYSRFGRYYYYWYNRVYTPGYYVTSTRYMLEANVFDTKTDRLIFNAQSESIDPATLDQLGHRFSIHILKTMQEKGIL